MFNNDTVLNNFIGEIVFNLCRDEKYLDYFKPPQFENLRFLNGFFLSITL